MIIKSVLLIGFLVACSDFAKATTKPNMASLEVEPNFEYGLTNKEFRVHYSGVGQAYAGASEVSIKIYDSEDSPVVTFQVPEAEKNTPKAYFFALETAKSGKYSVMVCADGVCSEKNPTLTEMPSKETERKLTCKKGSDNSKGQFVESKSASDEISLSMIPAGDFMDATKATQIDSSVTAAIQKQDPNAAPYSTDWSKFGVTRNPMYFKSTKTFYTGVMYNVKHFADFFKGQKTKHTSQGEIYTPAICERKYILSMNVHLFNEATKQVQYRFKTALHLSAAVKAGYILKQNAGPIHVEMRKTDVDIEVGTYKVWVSFCATEKDKVESTICSDPVVKADSFQVQATDE